MQTLEAIRTRKSIRKYLSKNIDSKIIEEILSAAMSAPSAMNEQPWQFIVIDKRDILSKIPDFCPYSQMAKDAPLAILVCGDDKGEREGFWIQDCSAATENLLLAAHEKSLGAVWTGVYPRQGRVLEFQKMLKIPKNIIPFALIVLGYPDEKPKQKDNFKREKIHYNQW
ncbi:MAG: NADH dehydrogenase [Chlamydiae bacterium SM23_39]|nr:MAG: NADH dehydrogenase [Chlamydiae bacterium SM23_39]